LCEATRRRDGWNDAFTAQLILIAIQHVNTQGAAHHVLKASCRAQSARDLNVVGRRGTHAGDAKPSRLSGLVIRGVTW
jgi:hypothetical protein